MDGRPRPLVPRAVRDGRRRVPGRGARRRAPAVHPLLVRLDGEAEGHPPHHGRLPDRRRLHAPSTCSTSSRRRTSTGARPTSAGSPGTRYIVYGPLLNGATSVMYEGAPDYPDKDIWWELCERYGVTIFYTAPTAIRACMKWGASTRRSTTCRRCACSGRSASRSTRRRGSGTTTVIGGERCPIVDTWWQTETGHIMISPLPGLTETKPGSATQPLPGIEAPVVDENDGEDAGRDQGLLVAAPAVAGDAAHALRRRRPLHRDLLGEVRQATPTSSATRPARTRTATSGSSGASTTCSTSPATACRRPRSSRRSCRTRRSPRPR